MVHLSTRRVWSLTLVASLLVLLLLVTPGRSSDPEIRTESMIKIAFGDREGLQELAAQRKTQVQKLLALAQNDRTRLGPALLSLKALGKLRAAEAAKPLVGMLDREMLHGSRAAVISFQTPYHTFAEALEGTVAAIGVPCRELILRELGELHGTGNTPLLKRVRCGTAWDLVSEVEYRQRLVRVLQRIEGLPCAVFLVKAKLAGEKDARRRKNLAEALKLLEAAAKKKPPTTKPATSDAGATRSVEKKP